jgi:hypothetical protein
MIEDGAQKLTLSERDFNSKFDKIYLNEKGLKLARELYRELYLKEKLAEKVIRNKPLNLDAVHCQVDWPICIHALEKAKRDRREVHVWTMRQYDPPNLVTNYWYVFDLFSDNMALDISRKRSGSQKNKPN